MAMIEELEGDSRPKVKKKVEAEPAKAHTGLIILLILLTGIASTTGSYYYMNNKPVEIVRPVKYGISTGQVLTNFNGGRNVARYEVVVETSSKKDAEELTKKVYLLRDVALSTLAKEESKSISNERMNKIRETLVAEVEKEIPDLEAKTTIFFNEFITQ